MPEDITTQEAAPAVDSVQENGSAPEVPASPKPLGENGEKALRAEREARRAAEKERAELAARLKSYEDRDLSELQKAQRDAEEYRERAAKAERAQLRSQVALDKGLPPEILAALVGETAEELTAHADSLLAWRGNVAPAVNLAPRPDKSQGAQPSPVDAADEALFAAYRASTSPSYR